MNEFLIVVGVFAGALLLGAAALHALPRLGRLGRAMSEAFCRAPLLDVAITYFTAAPLIAGPIWKGWLGLLGAVVGQVVGVLLWTAAHELTHPQARRGPRIVSTINRAVGPVRNHAALWVTALAVPLFWVVRVMQIIVYPPLTWLVRLPSYPAGDWVSVSRQKFDGLVGHDLIWCLYCDWMTGIWSLGSEMLRNVESFWCPIRFASGKKCANCVIDFPDLDREWVAADGTMAEVVHLLETKHEDGNHGWFGHPTRLTELTVNGAGAAEKVSGTFSRTTTAERGHPVDEARKNGS